LGREGDVRERDEGKGREERDGRYRGESQTAAYPVLLPG